MSTLFAIHDPAKALGKENYWPTPAWFAQLLVETKFADLTDGDHVLEAGCGDGRFLDALTHVRTTGIELQPDLAAVATQNGHNVIVGDLRTVELPTDLTAAIGNPPFTADIIDCLLDRLHGIFAPGGRAGFILPAYYFQTHRHVERLRVHWDIGVELIPRDLFHGLSMPLTFAMFTRSNERKLYGLAFYDETRDVLSMHTRVRTTLTQSRSTWREAVHDCLDRMGGSATLKQLYRAIEPSRPSQTQWWREKVRQVVQATCVRIAPETYALAA